MRSFIVILAMVTALGAVGAAVAQDKTESIGDKNAELDKKIEKLVAGLGDEKFRVREKSYRELKEIGEPARPFLEKAIESKDPEIKWRASRLLCLLDDAKKCCGECDENDNSKRDLRWPWSRRIHLDGLSRHLNTLFDELFERDFKPFSFRFSNENIFPDVDAILENFKRRTGSLNIDLDGSTAKYEFQRIENGEKSSFVLEISEDGSVKAKVNRKNEEGETTEEYTAKSLEEFKKNYPDVAEEFRFDGFRIQIGFPEIDEKSLSGLGLRLDRAPFGFAKKFQPKILGVYTEEVTPALRAHLGLGEAEGIVVTKTAQKSFAEKIGIQPMDIIVAINGKKTGSCEDIRKAMAVVEEENVVIVEIVRKGKRAKLDGKYCLPR